jgi:hypothetical protein
MIQKLTKLFVAAYIIFAVGLWGLDYLDIDITPLIEWSGLPADFLGATGIASGIGLTTYQVIRTAQLGLQTTSQQAVKTVSETTLGLVNKLGEIKNDNQQTQAQIQQTQNQLVKTTALLESIIEFEKLLAEKNKNSRLLNDESKQQLDKWIRKTEVIVRELKNEDL